MHTPLLRLPKVRSEKLRKSARGQPCSLRIASFIPGHSCASDETTVLAHLPVNGKGTGTKVSDLGAVYACAHCHDLLDRRDNRTDWIIEHYPMAYHARMANALTETHARMVEEGLIVVPDGDVI